MVICCVCLLFHLFREHQSSLKRLQTAPTCSTGPLHWPASQSKPPAAPTSNHPHPPPAPSPSIFVPATSHPDISFAVYCRVMKILRQLTLLETAGSLFCLLLICFQKKTLLLLYAMNEWIQYLWTFVATGGHKFPFSDLNVGFSWVFKEYFPVKKKKKGHSA